MRRGVSPGLRATWRFIVAACVSVCGGGVKGLTERMVADRRQAPKGLECREGREVQRPRKRYQSPHLTLPARSSNSNA
jgi:hypothetical protein